MDIVLEVFDNYVADYCYAKLLPASYFPELDINHPENASASFSSLRVGATHLPRQSQKIQTSPYLSLEPSHFAYESVWDRENIYRQTLSLFIITW